MITRKKKYSDWYVVRNEILGVNAEVQESGNKIAKVILLGLKNEDVTQGVAIKLNKIVKKINEEFKTLQEQLDQIPTDAEDKQTRMNELWAEECEIHFEPLDIDKLDIKRKDNHEGYKYDYSNLIEIITE